MAVLPIYTGVPTQTPPQGTHFSDGVRVGPLYGATYPKTAGFVDGEYKNFYPGSLYSQSPVSTLGDTVALAPGIQMGPIFVYDIVPDASDVVLVADLQTLVSPGYLDIKATALVNGNFSAVFDVARVVSMRCAGNSAGVNFIVYGTDQWGQPLAERLVGVNTNTVLGQKAFASVYAIYCDAPSVADVSFGNGDVLGLPYRTDSANYAFIMWNGLPAYATAGGLITAFNGTFTSAVSDPADATTGDVRGTYLPPAGSPPNGTRRLTVYLYCYGANANIVTQNADGTSSYKPMPIDQLYGVAQYAPLLIAQ